MPVPLTIPGCKLWLRGDLGLTQADGVVSGWADQSGNDNHASQESIGNRPAFVAEDAYFAGHPAVAFDGGHYLIADGFASIQSGEDLPMTVVTVAKRTSLAGQYGWSFGHSTNDVQYISGGYYRPEGTGHGDTYTRWAAVDDYAGSV